MLGEMIPIKQIHCGVIILDSVTINTIMQTSENGASHLITMHAHRAKKDATQRSRFVLEESLISFLAAMIPNRNGTPQPKQLSRIHFEISLLAP